MVFQIIDFLSGTKSCTLMLAKFTGKGMLFDVAVETPLVEVGRFLVFSCI